VRIPSDAHLRPDVGNLLATRRLNRAPMFNQFFRPSTTFEPLRGWLPSGSRAHRARANALRRTDAPVCASAFQIRSHATRQEHAYRYHRTTQLLTLNNLWIKTTEAIDGGHSEFKRHKSTRFDLRLGDITSASASDRLGPHSSGVGISSRIGPR
jgi:hypothetical protein